MKKKLSVILVVAFVVSSFMTVTAFAESMVTQDGMQVELVSEKQEYSANEDIDIALSVENLNSQAVEGVRTKITLPKTLALKDGNLEQNVITIESQAKSENKITAIKKDDEEMIEPSDDGSSKSGSEVSETGSKVSETGSKVSTASKSAVKQNVVKVSKRSAGAKTSDQQMPFIWLAIMCFSAGMLLYRARKQGKISEKGILSLLLCFVVTGAMAKPLDAYAMTQEKNCTVTEELTVDGKLVEIKADVTYNCNYYEVKAINASGSQWYREGDTVTVDVQGIEVKEEFAGWEISDKTIELEDPLSMRISFKMPPRDVTVTAKLVTCYKLTTVWTTYYPNGDMISSAPYQYMREGEDYSYEIEPIGAKVTKQTVEVDGKDVESLSDADLQAMNITIVKGEDGAMVITFKNVSDTHSIRGVCEREW